MPKFLRRNWSKASRLGKGRKKKQIWRSAKGRHSKMRNKRKGYPAIVEVGFRTEKKGRDLIEKKQPMLVHNVLELSKISKGQIVVLGRMGKKKKLEIAKVAKEKKIEIYNLNASKVLKKQEKINERKKSTKVKETKIEDKK